MSGGYLTGWKPAAVVPRALVYWVEDGQVQDHHYELAWLRAKTVRRFLKT